MNLPIINHDDYVAKINDDNKFPIKKFGELAKYLVNKLNNFQVSTGDILREEIKKDTDIGKKIISNMNNGKFVEDDIVNKLLEKIIFDNSKIIWSDKFPSNLIISALPPLP